MTDQSHPFTARLKEVLASIHALQEDINQILANTRLSTEQIFFVTEAMKIAMVCPACGSPLIDKGETLICSNLECNNTYPPGPDL